MVGQELAVLLLPSLHLSTPSFCGAETPTLDSSKFPDKIPPIIYPFSISSWSERERGEFEDPKTASSRVIWMPSWSERERGEFEDPKTASSRVIWMPSWWEFPLVGYCLCSRDTVAVTSDGSLFTWGANEFGQLGDGTENARKHPKKVKQLQSEFVISVSCGAHCTVAIAEPRENNGSMSARKLWVWGQNQGSNYPRLFWGAFSPSTVICQVSRGAVHVVALSEEELLQAWGYNEYGQLGRGVTSEGLQGPRVINGYAKFLDEAPELVKIIQVSCGEYHIAAISEKGEV